MPEPSKTERSTGAAAGTVAATGGFGALLVWVLGSVSAEVGAIISGALSTVAVFVWHTGIKNILRGVWTGHGQFVASGR
jgi:hypothetical protein